MSETKATITAQVSRIREMFNKASMSGDDEYGDLYFNILEDKVEILQKLDGQRVITYCTFEEDYFDEISLETETTTREGVRKGREFEYETGVEAIVGVDETLTYLGFANDSNGKVDMEFCSDSDKRAMESVRMEGEMEAWVRLPGSDAVFDRVPMWLPSRWTDDEEYTSSDGETTMPVSVDTEVSSIQRIIDAVEADSHVDYYPVVVREGDLLIDVGEETGRGVLGTLPAQVEGPDFENAYYTGFEEIFNVLDGSVELQTAPGGSPLVVVSSTGSRTVRHIAGPTDS